jgi:hypothetical protein
MLNVSQDRTRARNSDCCVWGKAFIDLFLRRA